MEKTVQVKYTVTERWYYTQEPSGEMKLHDGSTDSGLTTYALELLQPVDEAQLSTPDGYFEALLLLNYVPDEWYTKAGTAGPFTKPAVPTWTETNDKTCTVTLETEADPDPAEKIYPVTVTASPAAPITVSTAAIDLRAFALKMKLAVKTANDRTVYPVTAVWMPDIETETDTTTETGEMTSSLPADATSGGTRTTTTTLTVTLRWNAGNRTVTFGKDAPL